MTEMDETVPEQLTDWEADTVAGVDATFVEDEMVDEDPEIVETDA